MVKRVNEARRAHPPLRQLTDLRFLDTRNDGLLAYVKQAAGETVLCVVNLDPQNAQEGLVDVPADIGLPPVFGVEAALDASRYDWHVGGNYVRLVPGERQAHLFTLVGPGASA